MSNDSTGTPNSGRSTGSSTDKLDYLGRLLDLAEKWRKEITETTVTLTSISGLLSQTTACQREIKRSMERMEQTLEQMQKNQDSILARSESLGARCAEVWRSAEKKKGLVGVLDWAVERAQNQTKAFLLVLLAIIALAVLGTTLGWDLPAILMQR